MEEKPTAYIVHAYKLEPPSSTVAGGETGGSGGGTGTLGSYWGITTESITIRGLPLETALRFTVQALNNAGTSKESRFSPVVRIDRPPQIKNVFYETAITNATTTTTTTTKDNNKTLFARVTWSIPREEEEKDDDNKEDAAAAAAADDDDDDDREEDDSDSLERVTAYEVYYVETSYSVPGPGPECVRVNAEKTNLIHHQESKDSSIANERTVVIPVAPKRHYYFRVLARNVIGRGALSKVPCGLSGLLITPPSVPRSIKADVVTVVKDSRAGNRTATGGEGTPRTLTLSVSWARADLSDAVTSYEICYKAIPAGFNDTCSLAEVSNQTAEQVGVITSSAWVCERVDGSQSEAEVKELSVRKRYRLMAIAINQAGRSPPKCTELDELVHVAKPLRVLAVRGTRPQKTKSVVVGFAKNAIPDARHAALDLKFYIFCHTSRAKLERATIRVEETENLNLPGSIYLDLADPDSTHPVASAGACNLPCTCDRLSPLVISPLDAVQHDDVNIPATPLYFRVVAGNKVGFSGLSVTTNMVVDKCSTDEYFMNQHRHRPETWQCHTCPDGGVCQGRDFFGPNNTYGVVAKSGYWMVQAAASTSLGPLGWFNTSLERRFILCPNEQACPAGDTGATGGIGGYSFDNGTSLIGPGGCHRNYTGILCSDCASRFYKQGSSCVKCESEDWALFFFVFVCIAMVVGFMVCVYYTLRSRGRPSSLGLVLAKVLVTHAQLMALSASFDLKWPAAVMSFFDFFYGLGYMAASLFSLECVPFDLGIKYDLYQKGLLYSILPVVATIGIVAFWVLFELVVKCRRNIVSVDVTKTKSWSSKNIKRGAVFRTFWRRRVRTTVVVLLWILHPLQTKTAFHMFSCKELKPFKQFVDPNSADACSANTEGDSTKTCEQEGASRMFLVSDSRVECWDSVVFQTFSYPLGFIMIAVYAIGVPLALYLALFRHRHDLTKQRHRDVWGFLYSSYKMRGSGGVQAREGGSLSQYRGNKSEKDRVRKMLQAAPQENYFYWEMVIMFRKACLIAASVFAKLVSVEVQTYVTLMVVAFFYFIQLWVAPFSNPGVNQLEERSMLTSFFTLVAGAFLFSDVISANDKFVMGFTVWIVGINTLYLINFTYVFILLVMPYRVLERMQDCCGCCEQRAEQVVDGARRAADGAKRIPVWFCCRGRRRNNRDYNDDGDEGTYGGAGRGRGLYRGHGATFDMFNSAEAAAAVAGGAEAAVAAGGSRGIDGEEKGSSDRGGVPGQAFTNPLYKASARKAAVAAETVHRASVSPALQALDNKNRLRSAMAGLGAETQQELNNLICSAFVDAPPRARLSNSVIFMRRSLVPAHVTPIFDPSQEQDIGTSGDSGADNISGSNSNSATNGGDLVGGEEGPSDEHGVKHGHINLLTRYSAVRAMAAALGEMARTRKLGQGRRLGGESNGIHVDRGRGSAGSAGIAGRAGRAGGRAGGERSMSSVGGRRHELTFGVVPLAEVVAAAQGAQRAGATVAAANTAGEVQQDGGMWNRFRTRAHTVAQNFNNGLVAALDTALGVNDEEKDKEIAERKRKNEGEGKDHLSLSEAKTPTVRKTDTEDDQRKKEKKNEEGRSWAMVMDPLSGYPYWYNGLTGVSAWEQPPAWEATTDEEIAAMAAVGVTSGNRDEWCLDRDESAGGAGEWGAGEWHDDVEYDEDTIFQAWEACYDEDSGTEYYYNALTGQLSWETPVEGGGRETKGEDSGWAVIEEGGEEGNDEDNNNNEESDKGEWEAMVDDATGKTYYHNELADLVSWELPSSAAGQEMNIGEQNHEAADDLQESAGTWEAVLDDATGKTYYHNEMADMVSWEVPASVVAQQQMQEQKTVSVVNGAKGGTVRVRRTESIIKRVLRGVRRGGPSPVGSPSDLQAKGGSRAPMEKKTSLSGVAQRIRNSSVWGMNPLRIARGKKDGAKMTTVSTGGGVVGGEGVRAEGTAVESKGTVAPSTGSTPVSTNMEKGITFRNVEFDSFGNPRRSSRGPGGGGGGGGGGGRVGSSTTEVRNPLHDESLHYYDVRAEPLGHHKQEAGQVGLTCIRGTIADGGVRLINDRGRETVADSGRGEIDAPQQRQQEKEQQQQAALLRASVASRSRDNLGETARNEDGVRKLSRSQRLSRLKRLKTNEEEEVEETNKKAEDGEEDEKGGRKGGTNGEDSTQFTGKGATQRRSSSNANVQVSKDAPTVTSSAVRSSAVKGRLQSQKSMSNPFTQTTYYAERREDTHGSESGLGRVTGPGSNNIDTRKSGKTRLVLSMQKEGIVKEGATEEKTVKLTTKETENGHGNGTKEAAAPKAGTKQNADSARMESAVSGAVGGVEATVGGGSGGAEEEGSRVTERQVSMVNPFTGERYLVNDTR